MYVNKSLNKSLNFKNSIQFLVSTVIYIEYANDSNIRSCRNNLRLATIRLETK